MQNKAVILEAIKELHISDEPSLYKKFRRWIRKNIKRQSVDPIDVVNWPKGCLMVGLMEQALLLEHADNSEGRALSLYAFSEVKDYVDRWIDRGMPVYKIDDCLFGQALLLLAQYLKDSAGAGTEDKYMQAADKVYDFILKHDKDVNGSLPYRPAHKTYDIYADGIGMAVPFLVRYGVMRQNEEAIELGMLQIREFAANALDSETGIPFHAYSVKEELKRYAPGWGRALGWLFYGVGACIRTLIGAEGQTRPDSFAELSALRELRMISDKLTETSLQLIRDNGLFGSDLQNPESEVDTSASAMILYGMKYGCYLSGNSEHCEGFDIALNREKIKAAISKGVDSLRANITEEGLVLGAQGECSGLGLYSDNFGSYPWSVGMALILI